MPTQRKSKVTERDIKHAKKVSVRKPVKLIHEDKLKVYLANSAPTSKQYMSLQDAYTHYNKALFDNKLPPVLVTFQRQRKSYGYYWPDKLISRETGKHMAEIALAINTFNERDDRAIFSTLVHEMVHHWQQEFGEPSRNGYHNKEWANKMKLVGLYPSTTAAIGGEETGQKVSHYIIDGGAFDQASKGIGATIDWNSAPDDVKKKKAQNKVKYECLECEECNAWGKPDLSIYCGSCMVEMTAAE